MAFVLLTEHNSFYLSLKCDAGNAYFSVGVFCNLRIALNVRRMYFLFSFSVSSS